MEYIKKFEYVKNSLGLVLIGVIFAGMGGMIVFTGNSDGSLMPVAFMALGLGVMMAGICMTVNHVKKPAKEFSRYDRVDLTKVVPTEEDLAERKEEEMEEFVFHYTGRTGQDFIMKDKNGEVVYEAECGGLTLMKDTEVAFRNRITGEENVKEIGHTVTRTLNSDTWIGAITADSSFDVDHADVWDYIAAQGYSLHFNMHGLAVHYDVKRWGEDAGCAELAGTGLMNPKYKDNPLGKIPTNGIFKVRCRRCDIPGFFMICFAITKTEISMI